MRLATIKLGGSETAGIVTKDGILPVRTLNAAKDMEWPTQLFDLIESGDLADLTEWYNAGGKAVVESLDEAIPYEQVVYAASSASGSTTSTTRATSAMLRRRDSRAVSSRWPTR